MCNTEKFQKIYKEISELTPTDTAQLILEAASDDEKKFYEMLGDYILQSKQASVIQRGLF